METTIIYWGYIRIMENKMETTIVCWGYIGIMENKMETTIRAYIGIIGYNIEFIIGIMGFQHLSGPQDCGNFNIIRAPECHKTIRGLYDSLSSVLSSCGGLGFRVWVLWVGAWDIIWLWCYLAESKQKREGHINPVWFYDTLEPVKC